MRLSIWVTALMIFTSVCDDAGARPFPPDSGVLNVRDFGAKGDGRHDDTAALLAAIAAAGDDTGAFFWRTRIVYLPAGTYQVSQTLVKRYRDGRFGSGMLLIGESRDTTTIRLADHAVGFGDIRTPRGVIMTTAKLLDGTPTSGGKDYTHKGEGNDAYENFIEDLTVETGMGNPGAIGIDYLANNIGAIRDVRVVSATGDGATGISLERKWPGPALLQRVEVQGFQVGIAVANTEYGVTLDQVRLSGQRRVGLFNDSNLVAADRLTIDVAETAIANVAPYGLILLHDAVLRRASEGAVPLSNRGVVVARGVSVEGFAALPGAAGRLFGVWQANQWQNGSAEAAAPLADASAPPDEPVDRWVNIMRFVSHSGEPADITSALRQAMATGATTIYIPYGRYIINDRIEILPTVRRIVGMNASITVTPERQETFARDIGMFQIGQPGPPLVIERLAFDMTDLGEQLAVGLTARRDVTLRDIVTAGTSLINRTADGGRLFIEDVCCGSMKIAGQNAVYARQLDTEGGGTRIVNDGSPLTILGLKTEGNCTVIDNRAGAQTTILGGLLYIVHNADPHVPAFRNADASLRAAFVEESFRPDSRYTVYVQGHEKQREQRAEQFLNRGLGRIVPWLTAGH